MDFSNFEYSTSQRVFKGTYEKCCTQFPLYNSSLRCTFAPFCVREDFLSRQSRRDGEVESAHFIPREEERVRAEAAILIDAGAGKFAGGGGVIRMESPLYRIERNELHHVRSMV